MTESLAKPVLNPHVTRRHGYTLLELMLVLAVLTVIIAIAWPALRKPLYRSKVQEAASQLVKDLGQARLAAIEHGQIIRFRYERGGTRYILDAASAAESDREDSFGNSAVDVVLNAAEDGAGEAISSTDRDLSSNDRAGVDAGRPGDEPLQWSLRGELPDEVVFRDPSELDDSNIPPGSALATALSDEASEREEVKPLIGGENDESDLTPPVFFYPNGRAENAEMTLVGPEEYRIAVRVRGLTGAASLGPLEHPVREFSDRERRDRADRNRDDQGRADPRRDAPQNGSSDRGSTEREQIAAPGTERSAPADRPSGIRERD